MGKRPRNKLKPFVPIRRDMLESPEWRKLSCKAKVIYIEFKYWALGETTKIKLEYSKLTDMMSSQTISNGFKELQDAGFIRQISKGGMYGSPAIYDLIGKYANPYKR